MKYMLDSNICIYYIKRKPVKAVEKIKAYMWEGLCISAITLAELRHGASASACPERNSDALNQFAAILEVLEFDGEAAEQYGIIRAELQRKGNLIGPFDMLIAAHAKAKNLTLVTNNIREFARVEGLRLENWVE